MSLLGRQEFLRGSRHWGKQGVQILHTGEVESAFRRTTQGVYNVAVERTIVGADYYLDYYLDELRHRSQARVVGAVEKFTRWVFGLTLFVTVATIVNVMNVALLLTGSSVVSQKGMRSTMLRLVLTTEMSTPRISVVARIWRTALGLSGRWIGIC